MRWKRVALAGCLAPVLGGCHATHCSAPGLAADAFVGRTERGIEREIRRDAREAWRAVRCEFPRKVFTAEFRDGFLDGYADYLDRGGNAQPPAVPPPRYTRNAKYFTPEGHALVRDYLLGFKYGVDVAVATGHRQYLTVPVLIPEEFDPAPVADAATTPAQPPLAAPSPPPPVQLHAPRPVPTGTALHAPRPVPSESASVPPAGPGFDPNPPATKPSAPHTKAKPSQPPSAEPDLSKFMPVSRPSAAPAAEPSPALPPLPTIPTLPNAGAGVITTPTLAGEEDAGARPQALPMPRAVSAVKLPEPPADVPSLPAGVPTPTDLDDFPVIPPNHTAPPPLPANNPDVVPK